MKSYEEIKNKFQEKRPELLLAVCFVLVFVIGFGTGRYEREANGKNAKSVTTVSNYTTKTTPTQTNKGGGIAGAKTPEPKTKDAAPTGNCIVKGNLSSGGKKIYHVQGGAFYKTVKPEQCFNTETEAQAAGFIKSSR